MLAFAFSSVGYAATIITGETSILLLVGPGLAALVTRFIFYRNLQGFGWGLPKPQFALAAYALPILVSGSMYVLAWQFAGYYTTSNTDAGAIQSFITTATVGVLIIAAFSIGEELGWRGFLVPELAKITSFTNVTVVSGVIWAVWHWPRAPRLRLDHHCRLHRGRRSHRHRLDRRRIHVLAAPPQVLPSSTPKADTRALSR